MKSKRNIVAVTGLLCLAIALGMVLGNATTKNNQVPPDLEVPDDLSGGYAERIDEIVGRAESGELTWDQANAEIQDILGIASRHEIHPEDWQSPPTTIIEQGSGVEAASYIIFTDADGVCYAKSGDNGEIMYSGDNATVIQAAIDALPSDGGKIFVRGGTYTLPANGVAVIRLKSNVELEGEGYSTYFESLKTGGADVLIFYVVGTAESRITNVKIRNIRVKGLQIYHHAFLFDYADDCLVEGCYIDNGEEGIPVVRSNRITVRNNIVKNTTAAGIELAGSNQCIVSGNILVNCATDETNYSITVWDSTWHLTGDGNVISNNIIIDSMGEGIRLYDNVRGNTIANNTVDNSAKAGIKINCSADHPASSNTIIGNTIVGSPEGIQDDPDAFGNAFIGNVITGCERGIYILGNTETVEGNTVYLNTKDGIYIIGASGCIVSSNLVENNCQVSGYAGIWVEDTTNSIFQGNRVLGHGSEKYAIRITGTSDYNTYIGNNVYSPPQWSIITPAANDIIKHNRGYVTANSGTATLENGDTFVTVTHGLAATPTLVNITPITDDNARRWWVPSDNYGASNFVIYVDNANPENIDFNWLAGV